MNCASTREYLRGALCGHSRTAPARVDRGDLLIISHGGAKRDRDADLHRFLAEIERRGVVTNRVGLFSAHQMGTCRLGGSARTAVADPEGQVYGVRGLYTADAGGFTSATGVNRWSR